LTRSHDEHDEIKAILSRIETALARIEPMQKTILAEAKGARSSAEAAFAGMQALASVATAKPGPAEIAAAVRDAAEKVGQVHAMLSAAATPAAVSMPRPPAAATVLTPAASVSKGPPAGSAGTSGPGKSATRM
jgi:hypothetical protein